jgi:hypothetical protein
MAATPIYWVLVLCIVLTVRGQQDHEGRVLAEMIDSDTVEVQQVDDENVGVEHLEPIPERPLEVEQVDAQPLDSEDVEVNPQALCEYRCLVGRAQRNPNHTPTANGCGPKGITIPFNKCSYLKDCCNALDICYGTFGQSKALCDVTFKDCNSKAPPSMNFFVRKQCQLFGIGMDKAVSLAGCPFYLLAQAKATVCV